MNLNNIEKAEKLIKEKNGINYLLSYNGNRDKQISISIGRSSHILLDNYSTATLFNSIINTLNTRLTQIDEELKTL